MDEPPHAGAGRGARQGRGRLGLFLRARIRDRAVGPIGEMNDRRYTVEMTGPVGIPADVADRPQFDAGHRFARPSGSAEDDMAANGQAAAQRPADETGRPGHQDAHRFSTSAIRPRRDWARVRRANALEKCRHQPNLSSASGDLRYHHRAAGRASTARPGRVATAKASLPRHRGLVFLLASPADSPCRPGCRVCRCGGHPSTAHGEQIRREGFELRRIAWRRRGDGLVGAVQAISEITRLYRAERPDVLHHVALKPVCWRNRTAARLFRLGGRPGGRRFGHGARVGLFRRRLWCAIAPAGARSALRFAVARGRRWTVVQNPEDRSALVRFGIGAEEIVLIRGSGVDISHFAPLPDAQAPVVTVGLVSRMLREKGVLDAIAAIRLLRAQGLPVRLLLAGPSDPDNRGSLTDEMLSSLAAEPGIEWLGRIEDVRAVWKRAAVAVLPSSYGEGIPKALIEAAACARPIVATDVPGCREIVRHGETGILVPANETARLAEAIAALAGDPERRRAMGRPAAPWSSANLPRKLLRARRSPFIALQRRKEWQPGDPGMAHRGRGPRAGVRNRRGGRRPYRRVRRCGRAVAHRGPLRPAARRGSGRPLGPDPRTRGARPRPGRRGLGLYVRRSSFHL